MIRAAKTCEHNERGKPVWRTVHPGMYGLIITTDFQHFIFEINGVQYDWPSDEFWAELEKEKVFAALKRVST